MQRATCIAANGDEGTIAATCGAMSDEDARALAKEIVSFSDAVCELKYVEDSKRDSEQKK